MTASAELSRPSSDIGGVYLETQPQKSTFAAIWILLMCQALALVIQACAVYLARQDPDAPTTAISMGSFALTFASALWMLTRPRLQRAARNAATICLGLTTTLQNRMTDPLMFTGFDEQLHLRTLSDINTSHGLFHTNPILGISPRYPGLESVTALLQQLGLPTMAAAVATVLIARLVLVLTLCDAVEQLTGSVRAGGLAVAVYAVSSQFVVFNSSFAYQTLALPLALAAVALVARARLASDPRLLLGGATICLLAVAVTHHVTSWLTAIFLVMWAIIERGGQARRRIFAGAAVAVASTTVWAVIQWSLLREYFKPIIDDLASQAVHRDRDRVLFQDAGGHPMAQWERGLLLYYAAAISLITLALILAGIRPIIHRLLPDRRAQWDGTAWAPRMLLVLLVVALPMLFAARVLPLGVELGDRTSSFIFLPFSLLVADGVVHLSRSWRRRRGRLRREAALVLATGAFLGGYIMGSGPDWGRLPGPYLVAADNRAMDAEALAAVNWASQNVPAGSRIGADRISSTLLASQARLWPVLNERGLDIPSLYFADHWGPPQTELVRRIYLRYLYVDLRLADEMPHGAYFYRGETPAGTQLTRPELEKFDRVPGIVLVYRHGPVSIYDLTGLYGPGPGARYDLSELAVSESAWTGNKAAPGIPIQMSVGILSACALIFARRKRASRTIVDAVKKFGRVAGPSLTFAAIVGTLCIVSVSMILAHIWLGAASFLSALTLVSIVNYKQVRNGVSKHVRKIRWQWTVAIVTVALPVVVAVVLAVISAYVTDVAAVGAILEDPAAVHVTLR